MSKKSKKSKDPLPAPTPVRALPDFEEDSFLDAFKNEWKLFWHGLLGDEEQESEQIGRLSAAQYKQLMQMLSQDRRNLNLHIEKINKEIDVQTDIIQGLQLVGGDIEEALARITKLNDVGMNLSMELSKIDEKIAKLRTQGSAADSAAEPPPSER
jgi:hypothetical protein